MEIKRNGSVVLNHGRWYFSAKLPGEKKRRQVALCEPGTGRMLEASDPREVAEDAATRYWREKTRQAERSPGGITVAELCAAWDVHCREYYHGKASAENAIADVGMFREMFSAAPVAELTHADMLRFRDALIRSGICRRTVNDRLGRVKCMLAWALDEALVPAAVKVELTQIRGIKRGRTAAPERAPVRPVDDATIAATVEHMMPNTADMVRVHRLTGMRPCELCAMRWSRIDRSRTPWVYHVPPEANKNEWRGELGQPRVICIGPRAREILKRHVECEVPFSPARAMAEYVAARRAARLTPFYGARRGANAPRVPHVGERWNTHAYCRTIRAACVRGGITPWGANRLRHSFATEVRRVFGLDAARAVLGHTGGDRVTDVYSFDALEDEMIRRAAPAVEALG